MAMDETRSKLARLAKEIADKVGVQWGLSGNDMVD
jgi:hypothetical protein